MDRKVQKTSYFNFLSIKKNILKITAILCIYLTGDRLEQAENMPTWHLTLKYHRIPQIKFKKKVFLYRQNIAKCKIKIYYFYNKYFFLGIVYILVIFYKIIISYFNNGIAP